METEPHPYARRMNRVVDYIEQHLQEELSVELLAAVARSSKYHFQRQFKAYTGVTVTMMVRILRLKRAAYRLAFSPRFRIIDIAIEAGFSSPEAFSRAFRGTYGQSPTDFRAAPDWQEPSRAATRTRPAANLQPTGDITMKIDLIQFPKTQVAVLEHQGPPSSLIQSVATFIAWRKSSSLSPVKKSRTFGIPYSDPEQTPEADWRFDICGSVDKPVPDNAQGVVTKTIPGGRCAVAEHIGSTDRINETVLPMYKDWLPDSGEELRDFPCFFEYVRRMPDVAEHEQLTRVYLPLVSRDNVS